MVDYLLLGVATGCFACGYYHLPRLEFDEEDWCTFFWWLFLIVVFWPVAVSLAIIGWIVND